MTSTKNGRFLTSPVSALPSLDRGRPNFSLVTSPSSPSKFYFEEIFHFLKISLHVPCIFSKTCNFLIKFENLIKVLLKTFWRTYVYNLKHLRKRKLQLLFNANYLWISLHNAHWRIWLLVKEVGGGRGAKFSKKSIVIKWWNFY